MSENIEKDVMELKDQEMEQAAGGGRGLLWFSCPKCGVTSNMIHGEYTCKHERGYDIYIPTGSFYCRSCSSTISVEEAQGCLHYHD